mmetsp:Transcript_12948/g.12832  ORF Transcript_12948/g.12832 Transcript_12948/m.12832 type:complete len:81 (+) Transcript_12948:1371-1613(+)
MNKNFYRLLLYSDEPEKGTNFFNGVRPCNLYHQSNQEQKRLLEKQVKVLTTFNVWVDAVIQRYENYFMIRDTEIKMKFSV